LWPDSGRPSGTIQVNLGSVKPWGYLSWPNRISMLRLLLIAPFVVLLLNQQRWPAARYAAIGLFVTMAVSDFIDGVMARRLDARSRLGAILDPLADKLLIICAVVLLSLPKTAIHQAKLSNWVVVAIVGKDLWVIIGFLVIYLVTDRFCVKPTLAGKACTVGQLLMVGFILIAPDLNRLTAAANVGTWTAAALSWAVAGMCVLAMISYTKVGLGFIAEKEKPLEQNDPKDHPDK